MIPRAPFLCLGPNGSVNPAHDWIKQVWAFVHQNTVTATNGLVFNRTHWLYVCIDFFLRQPMVDFQGCKRAHGNLKLGASFLSSPANGPNIENLVKLVLDSLKGVLYHDNCQVISTTFTTNNCQPTNKWLPTDYYQPNTDNNWLLPTDHYWLVPTNQILTRNDYYQLITANWLLPNNYWQQLTTTNNWSLLTTDHY
jgi:hypothetical protein